MTERSERWIPVAQAVKARMKEVGMRRMADLYRASGLSEPTVRPLITAELRGGQEPSGLTCEIVSEALGWTSDSIARILEGGEPVVSRPSLVVLGKTGSDTIDTAEIAQLAERVADLAERVAALERDSRTRRRSPASPRSS